MAVPTISTVSPTSGPASGYNTITITGSNFRTVEATPAVPMTPVEPSVRVTISGQVSPWARALSSTEIKAVVPQCVADATVSPIPAVSIVVANLDDNGDPISGETATKTSAYTYRSWPLGPTTNTVAGLTAKEPPVLKVILTTIDRFYREVTMNTQVVVNVEYGEENGSYIYLAQIPSVNLRLSLPRDTEAAEDDNGYEEVERPDGTVDLYRGQRTYMVVFDIEAVGGTLREAMYLIDAIEDAVHDNPYIVTTADEDLYPGETEQYMWEVSRKPTQGPVRGRTSTTVMFSMQVRVRKVRVMGSLPAYEGIRKMVEAYLLETNMEGETINEVQIVS